MRKLVTVILILALVFVMTAGCRRQPDIDESDAVETVKAYAPFATWLDIPATYGEVFDKYIAEQEWTQFREDDILHVRVGGRLTGSGERVSFTLELLGDTDILPSAASLTGFTIESRADALSMIMSFFMAYNDGFEHYMDMLDEADITFEDEWLHGYWAYFWGGPVQYLETPGSIEFTPEGVVIIDRSDTVGTWSLELNVLTIVGLDSVEYVYIIEFWDEMLSLEDPYFYKIAFVYY